MQVATTEGKVVLTGTGFLPTEWNDLVLTVYDLTPEQEQEFLSLRKDRSETHFDGTTFVAVGVNFMAEAK